MEINQSESTDKINTGNAHEHLAGNSEESALIIFILIPIRFL